MSNNFQEQASIAEMNGIKAIRFRRAIVNVYLNHYMPDRTLDNEEQEKLDNFLLNEVSIPSYDVGLQQRVDDEHIKAKIRQMERELKVLKGS